MIHFFITTTSQKVKTQLEIYSNYTTGGDDIPTSQQKKSSACSQSDIFTTFKNSCAE